MSVPPSIFVGSRAVNENRETPAGISFSRQKYKNFSTFSMFFLVWNGNAKKLHPYFDNSSQHLPEFSGGCSDNLSRTKWGADNQLVACAFLAGGDIGFGGGLAAAGAKGTIKHCYSPVFCVVTSSHISYKAAWGSRRLVPSWRWRLVWGARCQCRW